MSDLSERSSNTEEGEAEEEEDEDVEIIYSQLTPYQDQPLAKVDASDNARDARNVEEGESDEDELAAATLEARYGRETPFSVWLVNSSFILDFCAVILGFIHLKSQRQTGLTRSHNTLLILQTSKSRLLLDVRKKKDLATFLPILFSCTLTFSSLDVVELLGANVNNARARI